MCYRAEEDGRIQSVRWLKIDIGILDVPGVMSTEEVAYIGLASSD